MSSMKPPEDSASTVDRSTKAYWRSLDRLYDSPALEGSSPEGDPNGIAEEFLAGASERPDAMSRRTMMSLMGATFALAGATGCRRPEQVIVPYVQAPEGQLPGVPEQYATTATLGGEAYGLVVESHDGRPTKIEGNSDHPSSLGAASPWLQASVLNLYDPDRSRTVLHRREGEGEEGLAAASWDDFQAAWQSLAEEAQGDGGARLAILVDGSCSPTRGRLAEAVQQRFPNATWVVHEPVNDDSIFEGLETATGQALRPVYHLEKAKVIVTLDADILGTDSGALTQARGFSTARSKADEAGSMNRLYSVESTMTVTSSMADHRLRLKSGQIAGFAAALAGELGKLGLSLDLGSGGASALSDQALEALPVIARDLQQAGSNGVVIAGRNQPPEVHTLALAMNQALAAVGQTVTLHELQDCPRSDPKALADLVEGMRQEKFSTILLLGGNPGYTAPGELGFSDALASVPVSVHLATHVDETSQLCSWHLPQTHELESWGDARAADGTLSLVQPLIAPLFEGRSLLNTLAAVSGQANAKDYDLVRQTARDSWAAGATEGFESAWRKALHDGLVADSASPAISPVLNGGAVAAAGSLAASSDAEDMEVVFLPSRSVFDGRGTNNSWLQEMPDPITKITWDNAALLSPTTAGELGVENGNRLSLKLGERQVEAAAWVLPGQADGSVAIDLGFGRSAAGRVGNGIGTNAFPLRSAFAPGFESGLSITKVGGSHRLVQTQEAEVMPADRRHLLLREATLEHYRQHPDFAKEQEAELKLGSLFEERAYDEGYQWGMAIDLNVCTGCNACVVACQSENNIPVVGKDQISKGREMHWLRVDRYFSGPTEDPEIVFQPVPCMHCENAPCEQVCPVAATVHDSEGINAMIYNRCIGTRYCSNNCPYKVRRFNFFNFTKDTPELMKMAMNPDVTVRSRGVMEKCSYCIQRINEGKKVAKADDRTVADGEVRTACQQTCPTNAISFGNILDANSEVSRQKQSKRDYVMLAELNNKPRTSYGAKLRNPNPEWPGSQQRRDAETSAGEAHS